MISPIYRVESGEYVVVVLQVTWSGARKRVSIQAQSGRWVVASRQKRRVEIFGCRASDGRAGCRMYDVARRMSTLYRDTIHDQAAPRIPCDTRRIDHFIYFVQHFVQKSNTIQFLDTESKHGRAPSAQPIICHRRQLLEKLDELPIYIHNKASQFPAARNTRGRGQRTEKCSLIQTSSMAHPKFVSCPFRGRFQRLQYPKYHPRISYFVS